MKKSDNRPSDYAKLVLITVQVLLCLGVAFIVFISTPHSELAIFLIAANLCLCFLANIYYDTIRKKNVLNNETEINKTIDEIRNSGHILSPIDETSPAYDVLSNLKTLSDKLIKKENDRQNVLNIVNTVTASMEIEKLFEELMPKLLDNMSSHWGAFYMLNNTTGKLELKSALGFSKNIYTEFDLTIGEGLIGMAALSREMAVLRDIPDDTVFLKKTFLGMVNPKSILLVPVINNDQLLGVLCLASIYDYGAEQLENVNTLQYYLGIALGNCMIFERTKRLTNELQFQNSLIQSLNEELESKMGDRTLFLKNIIDSIKDYAIYVLDKDGIIMEWNKGAEIIFGYTEDEVTGKHINVLHSEEEVTSGKVKSRINSVIKYGQYSENGLRYKKDGTRYYAEFSTFGLYNDKGELIGMTSVTKDITELKIAENEIWFQKDFTKKLVEGSHRALVITDEEFSIEFYNELALITLRSERLLGRNICALFEDDEAVKEYAKRQQGALMEGKFKLKASGESIYIKTFSLQDDLSILERFVFYFYTESSFS